MYETLLLPIDLNQESSWQKALPAAVELCKTFGSTLHVMNVVPDFGMAVVGTYFPEGFEEKALEGARGQLHEFVRRNVPEGVTVATSSATARSMARFCASRKRARPTSSCSPPAGPSSRIFYSAPTPRGWCATSTARSWWCGRAGCCSRPAGRCQNNKFLMARLSKHERKTPPGGTLPIRGAVCIKSAAGRGVAQPGRALRSGRRGRRFESSLPDQLGNQVN